ncbi:hypothetical protein PS710_05799 [Pseudomonas fluorescens]|uniref:Uncharacterized protein n=2 Tax=Pseudomonas fluorescens TaxID=294 RepID=A0A5E7FTL7_PSEFL|nr:hypothetical protein PS710_05799 [Pseudomonas fluorescens]
MRQKPGPRPISPSIDAPGTSTPRSRTPDGASDDLPFIPGNRFWPDSSAESSSTVKPAQDSALDNSVLTSPIVVETETPAPASPRLDLNTSPLKAYAKQASSKLPAPDGNGLRIYKGRWFVDVKVDRNDTGTQTVMVEFDTRLNTYRAKLPHEQGVFGPPLYRNAGSNVWSLDKPLTYFENYRDSVENVPDAQGYYSVRRAGSTIAEPASGFAFRDENYRWVEVDPVQARGDASLPLKLAQWTDGEIWSLYRIHGPEILLFRAQAQATGKAPSWVRRFEKPYDDLYLIDSLKWVYPHLSVEELTELRRSYNMPQTQQIRLRQDLASGQMPEWAEEHKRLTQDKDNAQRFKLIAEELEPYILRLRNDGDHSDGSLRPLKQYTDEFLDGYLEHAGYRRNVHGALYRTDIPSMFRGDSRTPIELARDRRLIHLKGNPTGSTTKRGLSATFSLTNAIWYQNNFGGFDHARDYNSQANLYPGRRSDSDSNSTAGYRDGDESDSDSSFVFDDSKDYPALRRNQKLSFLYAIDTRGVEVVPGVENDRLNRIDIAFEHDSHEGRISMPTRGISAERIWLINSELTRAARVEDILAQAGDTADAIEKATWAGDNSFTSQNLKWDAKTRESYFVPFTAYDALIDQIAASGKPVLELPKDVPIYANDIVWPVPEHYRT